MWNTPPPKKKYISGIQPVSLNMKMFCTWARADLLRIWSTMPSWICSGIALAVYRTHCNFLVILKSLINLFRCVLLGLELISAGKWSLRAPALILPALVSGQIWAVLFDMEPVATWGRTCWDRMTSQIVLALFKSPLKLDPFTCGIYKLCLTVNSSFLHWLFFFCVWYCIMQNIKPKLTLKIVFISLTGVHTSGNFTVGLFFSWSNLLHTKSLLWTTT